MSSSGTAAPINSQEASDLLHKLITESTKVQAAFRSGCGFVATVCGVIKVAPGGSFSIQSGDLPELSLVMFNPSTAVSFKYGDTRAFLSTPPPEEAPRFCSALSFAFPDGSDLTLFEIA